jgi:hypothetical protein
MRLNQKTWTHHLYVSKIKNEHCVSYECDCNHINAHFLLKSYITYEKKSETRNFGAQRTVLSRINVI